MFCSQQDIPPAPSDEKNVSQQMDQNQEGDNFRNMRRKAADARISSFNMMLRNDYENKHGECMIRDSLIKHETNLRLWQRNLKDEIQNVSQQHKATECRLRDVAKALDYFRNTLRVSEMCNKYRKGIPQLNNDCEEALQKEISAENLAISEMENQMKQLKISLSKLEEIKNPLGTDLDAKALNYLCLKSCDNTKPLLSHHYDLQDPVQPYDPCDEEQWEKNVNDLIQYSRFLRHESCNLCVEASETIRRHKNEIAGSWSKASHALAVDMHKDRYLIDRCQENISEVEKDISYCHLRIHAMHDEFETSDRHKMLDVWRLNRLNRRPQSENIKDSPVLCIGNELAEIENRMQTIAENFRSDEEFLKELCKMKDDLYGMMSSASQRLHANRENCMGTRRTVVIEGLQD